MAFRTFGHDLCVLEPWTLDIKKNGISAVQCNFNSVMRLQWRMEKENVSRYEQGSLHLMSRP